MQLGNLAVQLLNAVREGVPALGGPPILRSFDWGEHGITHPYLIFMTGRCGSTWLTSIIKEGGLAGNPDEFLNADVARYKIKPNESGLEAYFAAVVEREGSNGRFGLQIDPVRLAQSRQLVDWTAVFPPGPTSTFYLYRRDLLAQAWSWVVAKRSGFWHSWQCTHSAALDNAKYLPTDGELKSEMVRIRETEEELAAFYLEAGYKPYYLDYESLLSELETQMALIFKKIGIDVGEIENKPHSSVTALTKLTYSKKHELLADFSYRHEDALNELQRDRFSTSAIALRDLLMSR